MMKVAWAGSNQIILVSGLKIVAKSQSELWRLITNSSAKFKADPVSGVYAKGYHMIGTNSANSAGMTTSKYGLGRLAIILSQWAENDRPIKGQEIARLRQSVTKSLAGLWRPIIISLSANAQKIQKRDGQQSRQTWSILCPPPTLLTWDNKRNGTCHYTLGCLDHYPCRRLRLWNSLNCDAV